MLTPYSTGLSPFPDTPIHPSALGGTWATMLTAGATAVGGPGAGAVVGAASGSGVLDAVFHGGAATDAARQKRVDWTLQAAKLGSPMAAAIIRAGPHNVGGNETLMWARAAPQVPPAVERESIQTYGADGYWPAGQPDFYTDEAGPTHQQIVREARGTGVAATIGSGVQSGIDTVLGVLGIGGPALQSPGADTIGQPAPRPAQAGVFGGVSPMVLGAAAVVAVMLMTSGKRKG